MKYIVSSNSGFCFGVRRAIDTVDQYLVDEKSVISLGNLIHNKKEISRLKSQGLKVVDDIDEISSDYKGYVVIRSHGVGSDVYQKAIGKKYLLKDLTCPFVKKIHNIVSNSHKNGDRIIIFGNKDHPEIKGINAWADRSSIIIETYEELISINFDKKDNYIAVFQTTFNRQISEKIIEYLEDNYSEIKVYNTICDETNERQKSLIDVARKVDFMIVIGDKASSNSKKLYQISKAICDSVFIEDVNELRGLNFEKYGIVGISAGASTPCYVINEVIEFIDLI